MTQATIEAGRVAPGQRPSGGLYRTFVTGEIRTRPWIAVSAVMLGTFMTGLFTRNFAVSLADLRGAYGLSVDEGSELSTVTNALQLLLAPAIPLAVVIVGARRILITGGLLFALATLLTPLATGLPAVFAMHALIGILLGCFVPATLATVFANLPPRYWLIALAIYALRLTLTVHAPVPLAGFLVDHVGWQTIYWQASLCGALMALLAAISLPGKPVNAALLRKVNVGEIALFSVGLALVYAALDQGNRLDWFASGTIIALLAGAVCLLATFFLWQHIAPLPFAHPRSVLRRNILLPLLITAPYALLSLASGLMIPNFLATFAHLKADTSGDVLWWIIGGQILLVPAAIWLIRRVDARLTLALGLLAMAVGCWLGSFVTYDWRAVDFVPVVSVLAVGNAFTFLSALVLIIANARPPEVVGMIAYVQIFRLLGPTLGGAVITTLLRKREAIHSVLLMPYIDRARAAALHLGDSRHGAALAALVRREANVLAYRDVYEVCCVIALLSLVLVAFIGPSPVNPLTPGTAK